VMGELRFREVDDVDLAVKQSPQGISYDIFDK
jgi:hypothetical protein